MQKRVTISAILLTVALFLQGCATLYTQGEPITKPVPVDSVRTASGDFLPLANLPEGVTVDPAKIIPAGTPVIVEPGQYMLKPVIRDTIDVVGMLGGPTAGPIAGALGALFGLGAAVRNRKHARTNVALVKGVDDFRDAIRQVPGLESLDDKLTHALKTRQDELKVATAVTALLKQHQSPEKPVGLDLAHDLLTALQAKRGTKES